MKFGTKVTRNGFEYMGTGTIVGFNVYGFHIDTEGISPDHSWSGDVGEYDIVISWDMYPQEKYVGHSSEFKIRTQESQ